MTTRRSQAGRREARRRLVAGPCTWCGEWCDPDWPRGHRRKATWDHLVPQVYAPNQGYRGPMVRACSECNSRRQHRSPRVLRHDVAHPSREW